MGWTQGQTEMRGHPGQAIVWYPFKLILFKYFLLKLIIY
jgi:hypothetical protein